MITDPCCCGSTDPDVDSSGWTGQEPMVPGGITTNIMLFLTSLESPVLFLFLVPTSFCSCFSSISLLPTCKLSWCLRSLSVRSHLKSGFKSVMTCLCIMATDRDHLGQGLHPKACLAPDWWSSLVRTHGTTSLVSPRACVSPGPH